MTGSIGLNARLQKIDLMNLKYKVDELADDFI